MDTMILRRVRNEDIETLYGIEKKCFTNPWGKNEFFENLTDESNSNISLVIDLNDVIVGFIVLWCAIDEGQIDKVAVLPEYRRKGYAKKLLGEAIKLAECNGCTKFELEVRQSNAAAINLYSGMGFNKAAVRKSYYYNPIENAVIMTLQEKQPAGSSVIAVAKK